MRFSQPLTAKLHRLTTTKAKVEAQLALVEFQALTKAYQLTHCGTTDFGTKRWGWFEYKDNVCIAVSVRENGDMIAKRF